MRINIDVSKQPMPEQIAMLKEAARRPVSAEAEYPELSPAELAQFQKASSPRQSGKQTVTLRLSPQAVQKAKSLGKNYTDVLSRILEHALENPDVLHHNQ